VIGERGERAGEGEVEGDLEGETEEGEGGKR
jgi:hypothetical protein